MPVRSDTDLIDERYHYLYIHNVFGHFFKDTLDYFSTYLYPRFEYTVVGTYLKAVEYLKKKEQFGRETDNISTPCLILNPTGEFNFADASAGGRQLWRNPNMMPGLIKRIFEPIYQDANVIITPGFSRFKGEIELIMFLSSFYEYTDVRVFLLQIFGGPDRWIHPRWFNSFIILPDEVFDYTYNGLSSTYKLDWTAAGATSQLVKTTNKTEHVFPCRIKPQYKLTGISDGSTRYGSTDNVPEWRLTATIEYEIEIPSFLVFETNYLVESITTNVRYGSAYTENSDYMDGVLVTDVPQDQQVTSPFINEESFTHTWSSGLDETSSTDISLDNEGVITAKSSHVFKIRYYHEVTAAEADATANVEITLPETISTRKALLVRSRYGDMRADDHYLITTGGTILELISDNITIIEGDFLELYVFEVTTIL